MKNKTRQQTNSLTGRNTQPLEHEQWKCPKKKGGEYEGSSEDQTPVLSSYFLHFADEV